MKKIILFIFLYISIYNCGPSIGNNSIDIKKSQKNNIPINPAVTIGKLDNGLTYYIHSNKKPENRAEMLLVVNAGSVLETDDQQGLAHFLEHMAFNGTKNFPKQDLVEYLESIGLDFGPDLNAYTSFDETVYMLQVPTDDTEKMDKGFQILGDWAHNMTLEEDEIDKERGVVIEEWRLGQGANMRMINKQLPVMLKDSKYANRLPIGQKAVLDTFKYESVSRFYNSWYRPELMAVIAVGDFVKSDIESLIKKYFSKIPKSDESVKRPFIPVPDHSETLFAIASDPEASYSSVSVIHKFPNETDKLSINGFRKGIIFNLYNDMLGNRLDELTKSADPPFLFARSSKGSWVQTKQMYTLSAYVKTGGIPKGLEGLLKEAKRVQLYGFTQTELDRQKNQYLRKIEKAFNEQDKTESENYKWDYKNHFLENDAIPNIEYVFTTTKELLPTISLDDVNGLSIELIQDNNRVITASSPENDEIIIPNENDLIAIFNKVMNMDIDPYIDAVSNEPLVGKLNNAGKIISEEKLTDINVTEWILDNGVRVVLKPTDFKNDEILFSASSFGGSSLIDDSDFIAAETATAIVTESGIGAFTKIELDKLLSNKIVNVSPWINELGEGLNGSASPKDQETMFQLIYQYFYAPRVDSIAFGAYKARMEGWIENKNARPENVFRDSIQVTKSQHHFRARPWTLEILQEMDMERSYEIYKDRFADASDFTFFFVGNFNLDAMKPLVEMYLGSLPSVKRKESWKDVKMEMPKGIVENSVKKGMEPKSMVHISFNGEFKWNRANTYILKSLESVMDIKLREVMREDMGGTYGVWMWTVPKHYPNEKYEFNIVFGCSPDNVDTLTQALFAQIDSVQNHGINLDYIYKVQEKQKQAREVDLQENKFWLDFISSDYYHNVDPSRILDYVNTVDALSVKTIQSAANQYLNTENYVKVVLYPESLE